ncbi:MAG: hypothetical protein IJ960_03325 [Oscillospiraceae bacterium]|nr:hypothetical protein [Oscillospiraceae bacterium]
MRTSIFGWIIRWILILALLSAVLSPDLAQGQADSGALLASELEENIVKPLVRLLCSEEARAWCAAVLRLMLDCVLMALEFFVEVLKQALTALLTG